jgi:hypothetical protein
MCRATHTINVTPDSTVGEMKASLMLLTQALPVQMKVIHNGKILADETVLSSFPGLVAQLEAEAEAVEREGVKSQVIFVLMVMKKKPI